MRISDIDERAYFALVKDRALADVPSSVWRVMAVLAVRKDSRVSAVEHWSGLSNDTVRRAMKTIEGMRVRA
jgi:hypothetical protein